MQDLLTGKKRVNASLKDVKVSEISTSKLNQDATASSKGTIYQFCVAVQKCYEMVEGQKVLIESQGDVTISDSQQVETKLYSDSLTDSHINFWKTLRNWMYDDFDPTNYTSLILYTTQQFGERATISEWNKSKLEKRLEILQLINQQAKKREVERQENVLNAKPKTPEVLLLQEFVFDPARRSKLLQVIERFEIEACSPELPELHSLIKQQYMKGILDGKKDDYLATLIGFITQPHATKSQKWEITYDDFVKKVAELTTTYCRETRIFPRKCLDRSQKMDTKELEEYHRHTFVKKIHDIEYFDFVSEAIRDYIGSVQTVKDEFKKYEVPPSRTDRYVAEIVKVFEKKYRVASRQCSDIIIDSQNFCDVFTSDPSCEFEGFEKPEIAFRNGLLHAQLDDDNKNLQWRLRK
jgi:hypothetical protein